MRNVSLKLVNIVAMVNGKKRSKKFLRVGEVASRLDVTASHLYALIKCGKVGAVYIGHSVRIPPEEAESLLREGTSR